MQCECLDWIELVVLLFLIKFRPIQILNNFLFLAANITRINCVQIIIWVPHTCYQRVSKFARQLKDFLRLRWASKCSLQLINKRFNFLDHKKRTHPLVFIIPIKVVLGLYFLIIEDLKMTLKKTLCQKKFAFLQSKTLLPPWILVFRTGKCIG